jgi:hypothetical protein
VKLSNLIIAVALLIGFFPATAGATTCDQSTTNADIISVAAEGEVAYAEQRTQDLQKIFPRAVSTVECLGEKLDPKAAAAFHRLMAFSHLFARDPEALKAELAAARRLDGDYSYSELVDGATNHPLANFYEQAATFEAGEATMLRVADGSHNVGGVSGAPWFANLPGVIQAFRQPDGADEEVLWKTIYVRRGQDLPAWAVAPELPPPPVVQRSDGFWTKPWFYYAASGTFAAAAGGTYLASNSARSSYQDPSTPTGELAGLESRTNGLGTTSVVLAGAAGAVLVPAITIQFGKKDNTSDSALSYNP